MTRDDAERFTRSWIDAWNAFDVERVLALFADDAVFTSPKAAAFTGNAEVRGKEALRAYWGIAKTKISSLRFDLERFVFDAERREVVVVYRAALDANRNRACELFAFGADGRVTRGEAMYGAAL